ncbi:hypothetical protein KC968_02450 [Candidatus Saccharibacteria bacterium]|nr:hypothetical protein [Candidatus Saccharibacteria bacterium]
MLAINKLKLVSSFFILTTLLFVPSVAFANEGSKFRQCTDMPDENQKNTCLAQLNAGAEEACANDANKEKCINDFKFGGSSSENADLKSTDSINEVADCKYNSSGGESLNANNCGIINIIVKVIQALSGAVGIVVVVMIVWGGIQYTSSRDNPQKTAAAKEHIINAVMALVMYIFFVAILNWLIPGGVLT